MKKKILSLVLVLTMMIGCAPVIYAAEIVDSGQCGDNVYWELDSEGTLTISGEGEMRSSSFQDSNIIKSVVIKNGVTSIGSCAFEKCSNLTSVEISDSVTSIKYQAFYRCNSLISITIPDSVTSIGDYAFIDTAYYNDNHNWEDGALYIGNHLISADVGMNLEYIIKNNTKTIAGGAFFNEQNLTSIIMPNSVTSIGDSAFEQCYGLTNVVISNSLTSIGYAAFSDCRSLTNIILPESLTSIGRKAFEYCYNLTSVTVPNGVTYIGEFAFDGCHKLTDIAIPNNITYIDYSTFASCDSLTNIIIPNSVTFISSAAFAYCSSLTSVSIPDSVTSIGDRAFVDCDSLKDIYYSGSKKQWKKISGNKSFYNATIHYNYGSAPAYADSTIQRLWINTVSMFDGAAHLMIGGSTAFALQFYPQEAYTKDVIWYSTNPAVAMVDSKGNVTGISAGRTQIYAVTSSGYTSEAIDVNVYDYYNKVTTATERVNKFNTDSNYAWIMNSNNFLYWHAYLANDTNAAKYYFQNSLGQILFQKNGLQNIFTNSESVDRAEEILFAYTNDTYDSIVEKVEKGFIYKLSKSVTKSLKDYFNNISCKDLADAMDNAGFTEDIVYEIFEKNSYEDGVNAIAEILDSDNTKDTAKKINKWICVDVAADTFSSLGKVVDITNNLHDFTDEIIEAGILSEANQDYIDMLDYMSQNCNSSAVRTAASNMSRRAQQMQYQQLMEISAKFALNKAIDKGKDALKKQVKKVVGDSAKSLGGIFAKLGYDMGIAVSTEILHVDDMLNCADNIRMLSQIGLSQQEYINNAYNKFLFSTDIAEKEEYANTVIKWGEMLITTRELGEENYYKTYKYDNFDSIRELLGLNDYGDYDIWYKRTTYALNNAKGNLEGKHALLGYKLETNRLSTYSLENDNIELFATQNDETAYSEDDFYALFADKAFANAVLYSMGFDFEKPDWAMVTPSALKELMILTPKDGETITDISGVSQLEALVVLDLSSQNVKAIPDEISQLTNLQSINLYNNGITDFPETLTDLNLTYIGLCNNLITKLPEISSDIELDIRNNLLDNSKYLQQRYLYAETPVIWGSKGNVSSLIKLKDINGSTYDYNGDMEAVFLSSSDDVDITGDFTINTDEEDIILSINNSSNKNAAVSLELYDIESEEYTGDKFISTFKDGALRKAIIKALNMDSENIDYSKISDDKLCGISELTVTGAESIDGIATLKGLRRLNISNSPIAEIPSEISRLKNIQEVDISQTGISDISNITSLPNLAKLNISRCSIKDIQSIAGAQKLESLYADGLNNSNILNEIGDMSRFKQLSVSGNNITDISLLEGLNFDYLNIQGNYIDTTDFEENNDLLNNCKILLYESQINSLADNIAVNGKKITAHLYNNTAGKYDKLDIIIAVYDSNRLIECQSETIENLEGGAEINITKEFSDNYEGYTVKCFVWNSMESMIPESREYRMN